ncbi:MAG TPA: tetratricopeptide repeat protein [bacterium]|jgi:hypothetical protein|nr:tetratricopeptide repeat protein [bacterium]
MKKKKEKIDSDKEAANNEDDREIKTFSDIGDFLKKNKLVVIFICLFTLLIYANIITGDFVNLDDYSKILAGPEYKDIWSSIKSLDGYRVTMTIMVKLFGINSSALHVLSIVTHMVNGILVFILLYILFGKKVSLMGTFMFLSHPVNTEVLSWHAGYPYAARGTLILLILIFFALYKKTGRKKFLTASSLVYIFSLIFYRGGGWVLISPFLLVLMDQFILEDKIKLKNITEYLPYLISSLIFAAILLPGFFKGRLSDLQTLYYVDIESSTPLVNRIPFTIYMEFKTLAYPMDLSIYREGKYISPTEFTFMVFATMAVIFFIFYFLKKDRRISGLMLMMLFAILPSFSPIIIAWITADRYFYIPSVFSSAIISIAIVWVDDKLEKNKSKRGVIKKEKADKRGFSFYAPLFIILFYSVRTVIRNNDFRNSKNLWIATRKTAPYSYRVYNNMGDVLANEGDLEGALENFKISVALKPDYADAVHNIGHIYMVEGNFPLAKKYLEKSLEMNPRLYPSAYKLGIIYAEEGEYEKSKEYFEQCLKYEPTDADCNNGLQRVLQAIGRK